MVASLWQLLFVLLSCTLFLSASSSSTYQDELSRSRKQTRRRGIFLWLLSGVNDLWKGLNKPKCFLSIITALVIFISSLLVQFESLFYRRFRFLWICAFIAVLFLTWLLLVVACLFSLMVYCVSSVFTTSPIKAFLLRCFIPFNPFVCFHSNLSVALTWKQMSTRCRHSWPDQLVDFVCRNFVQFNWCGPFMVSQHFYQCQTKMWHHVSLELKISFPCQPEDQDPCWCFNLVPQ